MGLIELRNTACHEREFFTYIYLIEASKSPLEVDIIFLPTLPIGNVNYYLGGLKNA